MKKTTRVCPVCSQEYAEYPAISRIDNKTEICPLCGVAEALIDWIIRHDDIKEDNDVTDNF